ncbi:restriction endonuclease subunit S [Bacteroides sp. KH569_7]|uniref:Restriction endonuclease subunit S n=1 Tax=Bacteroides muris (ex Fokt et al. 2023) TaxID=2937417 RepID=A0A9X2SXW0_9BACE|nr:restriction endonuclease subunit S [Bacteroides muris (ex Fokt et al. 2023)]MCR6509460.1 restriction endonuclease subunit S [Bacteroides muris (ex Fokt et al. 2023)]
MSKLKELIDKYCPNGVEYKPLGDKDVSIMQRGTSLTKKNATEGIYPVISGGKTPAFYCNLSNRNGETITVAGSGAGAGYVQYWNEPIFVCDAFSIKGADDVLTKYLYYCLVNMQDKIYATKKGGGVPHVHISSIDKFLVPLPPPPVQEEIVKILDRFAEYAAELQAELQARQEQYEYYRNKLLTFNKIGGGTQSVIWIKMSEIGTFIRGKRFVRTDIVNDGVPCIHYGDMYTYYGLYATKSKGMLRKELAPRMRYAQKNDVVIVAAGENKDDIGIGMAWLGDEPAAVHDACFIFKSDLYPQYVSHYLRSKYYHKQIVKYVSEGKICSISAKGLGNTIIPIPSYEEQVRIATLLNKFDELVSDLSQGLPAEIKAVKEQYEYYRNKLLSFPKYKLSA